MPPLFAGFKAQTLPTTSGNRWRGSCSELARGELGFGAALEGSQEYWMQPVCRAHPGSAGPSPPCPLELSKATASERPSSNACPSLVFFFVKDHRLWVARLNPGSALSQHVGPGPCLASPSACLLILQVAQPGPLPPGDPKRTHEHGAERHSGMAQCAWKAA